MIENPTFVTETHHPNFKFIKRPLTSHPEARTLPSICRPKCQETTKLVQKGFVTHKDLLPRNRASQKRKPRLGFDDSEDNLCPPASLISPLKPIADIGGFEFGENRKRSKEKKKDKKKKNRLTNKKKTEASYAFSSSSSSSLGEDKWGFIGREDEKKEDATETIFSSRSKTLSSDSSGPSRKRYGTRRGKRAPNGNESAGFFDVKGKWKSNRGSFAVVKQSRDPYGDFRASMVEMIVEKHIYGAEDLEQLLLCFLSLNSTHHHRVIVEVFIEIWESLFFCKIGRAHV